jgi:tetratricopeptide (TPR) repeat protein
MPSRAAILGSGRSGTSLLALAALLLAVVVQGRIEARALGRQGVHPLLYLPSGKYLKLASVGFDELLADLIYLWSIQYYGNYDIGDRYTYLEKIYGEIVTELDPRYLDAYLVGSLIMTAEARRPEMALRLLDKGMARNPGSWILAFEAGYLCYNDLRDYTRAAGYFEKALKVPGVPPLVRRFYAEMYRRAGDKRTSLQEWSEIYESAREEYVRAVAWNHVHDLTVEVHVEGLKQAIQRFRELRGGPPRGLEELAAAGLVGEVPRDPEGRDYRYDPRTGEVAYRGSLILAR